jgi:uncharacterized cofD-like protein
MPAIKAIFFDLDDTLFDCSGSLIENARKRAAGAMVAAGLPLSAEEAYKMQVQLFEQLGPLENVFDRMCEKQQLGKDEKKKIVEAAFNAYNSDEVEQIQLFPDVLPTLRKLRKKGIKTALITSGIFERQKKKIELLGLQDKFDLVLIHDVEKDASKEEKFSSALLQLNLKPSEAGVVGDRIYSEIKIANKLGMASIRMLKGRFSSIKPRTDLEEPDFEIKNIAELVPLIEKMKDLKKKENGFKVVAIGGGTGLPSVLSGLRSFTKHLTAIVTVTDSGRSSGVLRNDLNVLPPGDIRNCIISLSNSGELMKQLFQYRFSGGKQLDGMSLGNLFIAALAKVTGSFEKAVKETSKVLAIEGQVLPSTLHDTHLCAELADGSIIEQEFNVRKLGKAPIKRVFLKPANAVLLPAAAKAIKEADLIVLGPGSLYTSVITNLLVKGMPAAIKKSKAKKALICNIMTQAGQTDNFTLSQHVDAVEQYLGKNVLDFLIINNGKPNTAVLQHYKKENAQLVALDRQSLPAKLQVVEADLIDRKRAVAHEWRKVDLLRHDSEKLAKILIGLVG